MLDCRFWILDYLVQLDKRIMSSEGKDLDRELFAVGNKMFVHKQVIRIQI